jgi:PAT family beta-lactamase induction signal transducer AmpG
MTDGTASKAGWIDSLSIYFKPHLLAMFALGFAAGLPFLLYFSSLSFWLESSGVDVAIIGFFSWFGLSYSLKFLWAPLLDRFPAPGFGKLLGKRRGWILVAQIGIFTGLMGLGFSDPATNLAITAMFSFITVFSSATQDVSIDAWRIEIAKNEDEQAPLSAMYQAGYRVGMIMAGGGALFIAGISNWTAAYATMAILIFVGAAAFLWTREPGQLEKSEPAPNPVRNIVIGLVFTAAAIALLIAIVVGIGRLAPLLLDAAGIEITRGLIRDIVLYVIATPFIALMILVPVVRRLSKDSPWLKHPATGPFFDFFWRYGWAAVLVLIFISTYRLSDIVMGVMAKPLYSSLGYSEEITGLISGTLGPFIIIAGAAIGGICAVRFGMMRTLIAGAVISVLGNLTFAWLATTSEPETWRLTVAIIADNLAGGFAGTIFIAYLSSLTNRAFTAAQYALFSSVFTLLPKLMAGLSGIVVEDHGYMLFFLFAGVLGVPAIALSFFITKALPDR